MICGGKQRPWYFSQGWKRGKKILVHRSAEAGKEKAPFREEFPETGL
jgi:hypothetical protein